MIRKEKYFDDLLHRMIEMKISDLHIDIQTEARMLMRRHKINVITEIDDELKSCYEYLRFKAGFDLSKGTQPQTGSFTYMLYDFEYHFRFSSLETHNRKHGVLRVLNMNQIDTLEKSVSNKQVLNFIKQVVSRKNGIILFSGMTGSGKTTTMFNAVRTIENKQIFTLENPIETYYDFCIQLELNVHQNINFETGLTQLLRHDPDVIVLGEIRSEEDLKQCIRCGLSGHLVLSTIHSSSIEATIHRLLDLNVSIYDLQICLEAIVYQEMEVLNEEVSVKYKTADRNKIKEILKKAGISKSIEF